MISFAWKEVQKGYKIIQIQTFYEVFYSKNLFETFYKQLGIFGQRSDGIMHLEMGISESKCTVNEMERAISDLRAENLRLRLDLGVKNDPESASADESLRSVDEEVQEVTAVRLLLIVLCYIITILL